MKNNEKKHNYEYQHKKKKVHVTFYCRTVHVHLHIYLLLRMNSNPDGEVNSGLRRVTNSNGILAILTSSVWNWLFSTGRVTYMLFWSFLTL